MHARIAERIVLAAHLSPNDTVFEIGPGTGMLTRELLTYARVIDIETDKDLSAHIKENFVGDIASQKLTLIEGSVQDFDPAQLPKGYKVVANIPYYLTGDIMRKFLSAENQPSAMTLLVQKEVAVRIARAKKESILSLSVKAYGTPKYEFTVPKGAFVPAPKVDSAVLTIQNISRTHFPTKQAEERFFEVIRAGFAHKRKFLSSNLKSVGIRLSPDMQKVRAEDLSLSDWLQISAQSD